MRRSSGWRHVSPRPKAHHPVLGAEGNLPYAAARVQARHGLRLGEPAWRRIEASRHLGEYLEATRRSALAAWTARIDAAHDAHAIERTLRSEWHEYVRAVASWHPHDWQGWLDWWSWLPLLPLVARLADPEPVPAWMLADPVCGPIAVGDPGERAAALEHTPLAALAPAVRAQGAVGLAWREEAARRSPSADDETRAQLTRLMDASGMAIAAAAPATAAVLLRLFRAAAGSAVASGCHLALLWLDFERLRGGLVVRGLLGAARAEAA
jgi:hypothetical protein